MNPVHVLMSCSLTSTSILVLFPRIHTDLKNGHVHLGFPTNILYVFLFFLIQATCSLLLTLLDLMRSTSPDATEYAVLSDSPSVPPSLGQPPFSAPSTRKSSAYVFFPPLISNKTTARKIQHTFSSFVHYAC
jgi:hypothetical protein